MALLKKVNDIEFYFVPNQHWVVSAFYPDYKDLEFLLDFTTADMSAGSCTVNGIQQFIENEDWTEQRTKYKKWMSDVFEQLGMPIQSVVERQPETPTDLSTRAWTVNYFPGGWQAGHFHSTDRAGQQNRRFGTSVMMFDRIEPTRKNLFNGCNYVVLQGNNGYTYDHKFHPEPGKVIMMDDRVWHGAYPTDENRRVLVWDFDINESN
tara:strand:- start:102 stop:722 length:621 start_codon:yes stop_codon:yes gene_type:complete